MEADCTREEASEEAGALKNNGEEKGEFLTLSPPRISHFAMLINGG